jgi:hypothetical protein
LPATLLPFIEEGIQRGHKGGSTMKSKLVRAFAAALVIGTLLLAGTAPFGAPRTDRAVIVVDLGQ